MKGSMINKARPFEKLSPFGEVFRVLGLTAMLLLGSMVFAQAGVKGQAKKLAPDLRKLNPGATVDVIIQFANTPTEKHFNEVKGKGGLEKVRLEAIKGGAFTVPAAKLGELAVDPDVAYISPDRPLKTSIDNAARGVLADYAGTSAWTVKASGLRSLIAAFTCWMT